MSPPSLAFVFQAVVSSAWVAGVSPRYEAVMNRAWPSSKTSFAGVAMRSSARTFESETSPRRSASPNHGSRKSPSVAGDAHALARGDEAPSRRARKPVGTRRRALNVRVASLVALPRIDEESKRGRVQVCRLFCNPFPQLLEITIPGDVDGTRL
jgi:hypothetical protein